jgi:hypothetical protein
VKYWEIIADRLSKAGWSLGWVSAIDCEGRTIWIVDAHRDDGKRIERKDINYELIQISNNDKNPFTPLGDIGAAYRSASGCYADSHSTSTPTTKFGAEQHQYSRFCSDG